MANNQFLSEHPRPGAKAPQAQQADVPVLPPQVPVSPLAGACTPTGADAKSNWTQAEAPSRSCKTCAGIGMVDVNNGVGCFWQEYCQDCEMGIALEKLEAEREEFWASFDQEAA